MSCQWDMNMVNCRNRMCLETSSFFPYNLIDVIVSDRFTMSTIHITRAAILNHSMLWAN